MTCLVDAFICMPSLCLVVYGTAEALPLSAETNDAAAAWRLVCLGLRLVSCNTCRTSFNRILYIIFRAPNRCLQFKVGR
jgi:hypothetical protein